MHTAGEEQYAEIIAARRQKLRSRFDRAARDTEDQGPPIGIEYPGTIADNDSAGPTLVELQQPALATAKPMATATEMATRAPQPRRCAKQTQRPPVHRGGRST